MDKKQRDARGKGRKFTLILWEEEREALEKQARREGRSVASLIRRFALGLTSASAFSIVVASALACKTSRGAESTDAGAIDPLDIAQAAQSLGTILDEYAANEVRADGDFKGKSIATAGVIRDIRKDAFGKMHIRFDDVDHRVGRPQAECIPDGSETAIVSSLSKNQAAGFRGIVRGLVFNSVLFGDCEIRTEETGR